MRVFTAMLRVDVKEGVRATARWWVAALAFMLLFLATFALSLGRHADVPPVSWADCIAFVFMGSPDNPAARSDLPVAWLGLVMVALFLVLWYPYRDLMGAGQRLLVQGGSRWAWWASKVAWVTLSVAAFWLLTAAAALAVCIATGGDVSFEIGRAPGIAANLEPSVLSPVPGDGAAFVAGTLLALVALALLQLTVSLAVSPLCGYGVSVSLLVCAVFVDAPWLVPVYLMGARCDPVVAGGLEPVAGMAVSLVVCVASALVGGRIFSTMNILPKER